MSQSLLLFRIIIIISIAAVAHAALIWTICRLIVSNDAAGATVMGRCAAT